MSQTKNTKLWAQELAHSLDYDKASIKPMEETGEFWGGLKAMIEFSPNRVVDYLEVGVGASSDDKYMFASISWLLERREVSRHLEAVEYLLGQIKDHPARYTMSLARLLELTFLEHSSPDSTDLLEMLIQKHDLAKRKDINIGGHPLSAIEVVVDFIYNLEYLHSQGKPHTSDNIHKLAKLTSTAQIVIDILVQAQCAQIDETFLEAELRNVCLVYSRWNHPFDYLAVDLLVNAGAKWERLVEQLDQYPECVVLLTRPAVKKKLLEKVAEKVVTGNTRNSTVPKPKI